MALIFENSLLSSPHEIPKKSVKLSRLSRFWVVFSTEFRREFFSKRTVGIIGIFALFTSLILFIVRENYDQLLLTQPDLDVEYWSYQVAITTIGFFAGIIGIAVAAYLGAQFLTKDLDNGAVRLLTSTSTERSIIYSARSINAAVQYFPLSVIAGGTVVTVGAIIGMNRFDLAFSEIQNLYFKTLIATIVIIFTTGFMAASLANLFGIITSNETQGIIFSILLLVFGDLVILTLAGIWTNGGLENLSIGYHKTELLEYFLQTNLQNGAFGPGDLGESASIGIPWISVAVLFLLPIILLYFGYLLFQKKDLE